MMDNQPPLRRVWMIAAVAVLVGISALIGIRSFFLRPAPEISEILQSPTPTPTPIRVLSAVATQSAFLALVESHASLSARLTATNLDDPSLTPPVLDLPLGFR